MTPDPLSSPEGLRNSSLQDGNLRDSHLHNGHSSHQSPFQHVDALNRRNRALQAVPDFDWERFSVALNRAVLVPGKTLWQVGQEMERVYFPQSGLISLVMEDGTQGVEIYLSGRESCCGAMEALSQQPSLMRAQIQAPGTALWMEVEQLRHEFRRGGPFAAYMMRYFNFVTGWAGCGVVCNRLHNVEQRLARWLLAIDDHLDVPDLEITHDAIAQMLGTRRSGVTVSLGAFQKAGLIQMTRGSVRLLDRAGLENMTCRCYHVLRDRHATLWTT